MHLESRDFEFLQAATGLSPHKLLTLLEEDTDLLFEALADKLINDPILNISFPLYIRLSIAREAKALKSSEKDYVTRAVTIIYPNIHTESPYLLDKYIKNRNGLKETDAQYYLVLAGLFPGCLSKIWSKGGPRPNFYITAAETAFKRVGKDEIAEHIWDWIKILNKIKVAKKLELA